MRPTALAAGVLLLAVGNHLGKARRNGFIGLKTALPMLMGIARSRSLYRALPRA